MAEVPTGVVTFLITDIEGSTQLVKRLRDRYAEVLEDHRCLLRDAFTRHGGHEVDTQGDSFFFAFATARDAVLAAVEAQRALAGHAWADSLEISVRMGIHTGRALATDGRYTGLAVHRVARVTAAGHGAQILVSQATQTLLEDEEEELEIGFRDLGEHRLKDLDRPVRLYQVVAPGLRVEFPPPRGEAGLAAAAEDALAPAYTYRRPLLLGALALAAAALVAVALAARPDAGGLDGVRANHVGVIDASSGDIEAEVPVGLRPGPLAIAPDAVWVANVDDRSLTRVDPGQRAAAGTVQLGATPTGVAAARDAVWVALGRLGSLVRIGEFEQITDTIDVAGPSPIGSVAVGAGAVWAAYGDATLARVSRAAPRVTASTTAVSEPTAVLVALGDVWVANAGEGGSRVTRYRPDTFELGAIQSVSVGRNPAALAFGAGSLWVANNADDTVSRVDPDTGTRTISVGDAPVALAFWDGAVWVANRGDRTVSKIDAATNEVVKTIEIGNVPSSLAAGHGFVWVSVQAP